MRMLKQSIKLRLITADSSSVVVDYYLLLAALFDAFQNVFIYLSEPPRTVIKPLTCEPVIGTPPVPICPRKLERVTLWTEVFGSVESTDPLNVCRSRSAFA